MTRASAALAVCVMTLCACARPPHAGAPPTVAADPDALYAYVRRQEALIRSLRARFAATVHRGDESRHADGVLLVKKPERFRVRLLSPFGLTVFDYTSAGMHARMALPLEGQVFADAEIADHSAFSPVDLRPAFLRAEAAFPGHCTPRADGPEVVVDCRAADAQVVREVRIDAHTGTITREVTFVAGRPHVLMQFADYRAVERVDLPFVIDLTYPDQGVQLHVALRSYEVNPDLPDALFAFPEKAGSGS